MLLIYSSLRILKMGGRSGSSYLKTAIYIIRILMLQIKWTIVRFFTSHIDTYTCLVGKTAIVTGGSSGKKMYNKKFYILSKLKIKIHSATLP